MTSGWDIECPVCGKGIWGDGECWNDEIRCPECGSRLEVSAEAVWDTLVEILEERHDNEDEDDEPAASDGEG